jgi:hypothetical protein
MDIDGKPAKAVTVELPSGAEFVGAIGPNTKAQFIETHQDQQIIAEGRPRASKPGEMFMGVISNTGYKTETHFVTISVLGTYLHNNEGIIVLQDITTHISKKERDKEQKAK